MSHSADAEAHLRVIRSLMERSTHYRAISAPGALVGGLLSSIAGGWMLWRHLRPQTDEANLQRDLNGPAGDHTELLVWLGVLVLTAVVNLYHVWRTERRAELPFFSSRALWALRALAPSFILASLVSLPLSQISLLLTGLVWSGGYAVGLLAASHFAPRSLQHLGRAFYVATLAGFGFAWYLAAGDGTDVDERVLFEIYMAGTFGLFHLVYAALTWPCRGAAAAPADV